jgi:hypothetical protein
MQTLVNDTAAQIQLSYRQHPAERERRREQLAVVVAAWRAADRSEVNNDRLAAWLQDAMHSSMPGSREPLPAAPAFSTNAQHELDAADKSVIKQAPSRAPVETDIDPFRDDPEGESE